MLLNHLSPCTRGRLGAARWFGQTFAVALVALIFAGCGEIEQIQTYRAPKDPPEPATVAAGPATDRMWGAIVPHGEAAWFFKATGPKDVVVAQEEALDAFLKTVKFAAAADAKPEWSLPEGWKQVPASGLRFATIEIPADGKPLELSVITLPWDTADEPAALLSNVNRWRDQLGVPHFGPQQLKAEIAEVMLEGATASVVSFEGRAKADGMARPPFASGRMPATSGAPPAKVAAAPASEELKYSVPEGWAKGAINPFRKAAFIAVDGNKKVEITVSTAGGDLLGNVNRWRGQVKLDPTTAEQLAADAKKIDVGAKASAPGEPGASATGAVGDYVELIGPDGETILGVVVSAAGQQWFIKLTGDSNLAAREKPKFEAFVKSLRFGG